MKEANCFSESVGGFGQAYAATQAAMNALTENNGNGTNNHCGIDRRTPTPNECDAGRHAK